MRDDRLQTEQIDYSRVIDCIDDAFLVLSPEGKILKMNGVALELRLWGKSKPTENGAFLDFLPNDRQKVSDTINQAIRTGGKQYCEFERVDNTQHSYYEIDAFPILDEGAKLLHLFVIIQDMTTRKITEKRVQVTTSEMASLIETANAVIFGIDASGYVTDWNSRCASITGFEKSEVYAQSITDHIIPARDHGLFQTLVQESLNGKDPGAFQLHVNTRGDMHTFLLSLNPRRTLTGDVVGLMFVGEDITELLEYRDSLEQKVQERTAELMEALSKEKELVNLKSRFVSIASHEFRTPLSSILFSAGYLEKYYHKASIAEIEKKIDAIKKNVQHMTILLDDILTIGKNESGKIQVNLSIVEFEEFLKSVIEDVRTASNNSHVVRLNGTVRGLRFKSDEKLLRNIYINLLGNAIKYSPGAGRIELYVSYDNDKLETRVRDYGIGIAPEELDSVFDAFQRASNTENIRGTGLGLSIVKKAVELLEGTISVKSELNKGSEFTVAIPVLSA